MVSKARDQSRGRSKSRTSGKAQKGDAMDLEDDTARGKVCLTRCTYCAAEPLSVSALAHSGRGSERLPLASASAYFTCSFTEALQQPDSLCNVGLSEQSGAIISSLGSAASGWLSVEGGAVIDLTGSITPICA